ncbi:MAG TPA: lactate utilization protein [Desulfobacterales bacterium]|nr:lactate utilization protein [Desulfobacterales bacterium]
MDSTDQIAFIRRIRTALGHAPDIARTLPDLFAQAPTAEERELLERIDCRSAAERRALFAQLVEAGKPLRLNVTPVADAAAAGAAVLGLIDQKSPEWGTRKSVAAWRHPLVDSLDLGEALAGRGIPLHVTEPIDPAADAACDQAERDRQRAALIESFIGVTSADVCMADTATLVMRNRPGQPRSVALVPSIHVAVIALDQLLADMKELFALLRWDERFRAEALTNYMSFISGPSKTADIEATMVHGAHGPREVHLFVVSG